MTAEREKEKHFFFLYNNNNPLCLFLFRRSRDKNTSSSAPALSGASTLMRLVPAQLQAGVSEAPIAIEWLTSFLPPLSPSHSLFPPPSFLQLDGSNGRRKGDEGALIEFRPPPSPRAPVRRSRRSRRSRSRRRRRRRRSGCCPIQSVSKEQRAKVYLPKRKKKRKEFEFNNSKTVLSLSLWVQKE